MFLCLVIDSFTFTVYKIHMIYMQKNGIQTIAPRGKLPTSWGWSLGQGQG